jgi:ribosomal protein L18
MEIEEEIKDFIKQVNDNRVKEEEMLSHMTDEEVKSYFQKKTQEGIDIAKKLGIKVGE